MKDLPATIDVVCGGREEIFATAGWQLIAKFSQAVRTITRWTGNGDLSATEEFVRTSHVLMQNAEWCIVRVSTNSEPNSLVYFSLSSLLAHLESEAVHPECAEAVKNAALRCVWSESTTDQIERAHETDLQAITAAGGATGGPESIPANKRTKPMSKREALNFIGWPSNAQTERQAVDWLTQSIRDGEYRWEKISHKKGVFHVDDFPEEARKEIRKL